jgi:uncharacterized DUF497 family protein
MVAIFDWDSGKEQENLRKHGVSFTAAQAAFFDPGRVIARDVGHSENEPRYYCFGRTDLGVLTVRFTYRGSVIRIFGAGYWRKGRQFYEAQSKIHR